MKFTDCLKANSISSKDKAALFALTGRYIEEGLADEDAAERAVRETLETLQDSLDRIKNKPTFPLAQAAKTTEDEEEFFAKFGMDETDPSRYYITKTNELVNNNLEKTLAIELTQNSIDAFLPDQENKELRVSIKDEGNYYTVEVQDNGRGMTAEEVNLHFLKLGSKGKEGTTTGGAYGQAKAVFLLTPESFSLNTISSGKHTTFSATREEALSGTIKAGTIKSTTEASGTTIKLYYNKTDANWKLNPWSVYNTTSEVLEGTKISGIKATVEYSYSSKTFETKGFSDLEHKHTSVPFEIQGNKGTIHFVHEGPSMFYQGTYFIKFAILNKGLPLPFLTDWEVSPGRTYSADPGFNIYVNFDETSDIKSTSYPFISNRTKLNGAIVKELKDTIQKHLNPIIEQVNNSERARLRDFLDKSLDFNGVKVIIPSTDQRDLKAGQSIVSKHSSFLDSLSTVFKKAEDLFKLKLGVDTKFSFALDKPNLYGYRLRKEFFPENIFAVNLTAFASDKLVTSQDKAAAIIHTMVHEFAHNDISGHDEHFAYRLFEIYTALGHNLLGTLEQEIVNAIDTHQDALGDFSIFGNSIQGERTGVAQGALESRLEQVPSESAEDLPRDDESRRTGQRLDQKRRAEVEFTTEGAVITLFEDADLSSFLHESAHIYFRYLRAMVEQKLASVHEEWNYRVLNKWFGRYDDDAELEKWYNKNQRDLYKGQTFSFLLPEQRDAIRDVAKQELFARGFEQYLREGDAPSFALRNTFKVYRKWLTEIYKQAKMLDVKLTDDVRAVFDAILATDEEIKLYKRSNRAKSLHIKGMAAEDTHEHGKNLEVAAEVAHDKIRKERLRGYAKRIREWREQAFEIIKANPIYELWDKVKHSPFNEASFTGVYGTEVVEQLKVKGFRFNKESGLIPEELTQHTDQDISEDAIIDALLETPRRQDFIRDYVGDKEAAYKDEIVTSGEMLFTEEHAKLVEEEIKRVTSLVTRKSVKLGANEKKILNKLNFLKAEIELLRNSAETDTKKIKSYERRNKALSGSLDRMKAKTEKIKAERKAKLEPLRKWMLSKNIEDIKRIVDDDIANLKVKDFKRAIISAAALARKQADVAVRAALREDYELALNARKLQLRAELTVTALNKAVAEVEKIKKFTERWKKSLAIQFPHREWIRRLGKRFGLIGKSLDFTNEAEINDKLNAAIVKLREATKSGNKVQLDVYDRRVKSLQRRLATFLENQKTVTKQPTVVPLADLLDNSSRVSDLLDVYTATSSFQDLLTKSEDFVHYMDLSFEEMKDLNNLLRFLKTVGTAEQKAFADKRQIDIVTRADLMVQKMKTLESMPVYEQGTAKRTLSDWRRTARASQEMFLDFTTRAMDGFKKIGPARDFIRKVIKKAMTDSLRLSREFNMQVLPHMLVMHSGYKNRPQKFDIVGVPIPVSMREQGYTKWTTEMMFSTVLLTGLKENVDLLRDGWGFTDDQIKTIQEQLTDQELLAIQGIWDVLDTLFEPANQVHITAYGYPAKKLRSTAFTVRGMQFRGGYYPAMVDKRFAEQHKLEDDEGTFNLFQQQANAFQVPAVKRTMLLKRSGGTIFPPRLDLNVLHEHIFNTIHLITHMLPIRDIDRITRVPEFQKEFERAFGTQLYNKIRPYLTDLARPSGQVKDHWDKFWHFMVTRGTLFGLTWRLTSAVKQLSAVWAGMREAGHKTVLQGYNEFMRDPLEMRKIILELSPYMRERMGYREYDAKIATKGLTLRNKAIRIGDKLVTLEDVQKFGFFGLRAFEGAVSLPLWLGVYNKEFKIRLDQGMHWETAEVEAVAIADEAVQVTQGAMTRYDVSEVQRKWGMMRLFTMFSSWALQYGNNTRYQYRGWREGKISTEDYAKHVFYDQLMQPLTDFALTSLPWMLLTGGFSDDEDEKEKWWIKLIKQMTSFWMGGGILSRNLGSMMLYGRDIFDSPALKGTDYFGRVFKHSWQAAKEWSEEGEISDQRMEWLIWNVAHTLSFGVGIPASRFVQDSLEAIKQLKGEEEE